MLFLGGVVCVFFLRGVVCDLILGGVLYVCCSWEEWCLCVLFMGGWCVCVAQSES